MKRLIANAVRTIANDGFLLAMTLLGLLLLAILFFVLIIPKQTDFERRDAMIQACLQSERYSRDECIQLAEPRR